MQETRAAYFDIRTVFYHAEISGTRKTLPDLMDQLQTRNRFIEVIC